MRPRLRALLFAVIAVAASGGAPLLLGSGGALEASLHGISRTGLRFTAETVEFGTIWTGERVAREFEFENPTAAPIRILDVAPTCGCVTVEAPVRYVEAGARGAIRATFASEGRFGPQTLRIRVRTDEGERRGALLTLAGTVDAALRPRPARLLLGAVPPGSTHDREIALEMREPVTGLAATARGEGIAVQIDGATLRLAIRVPWATGTRFQGVALTYRVGEEALETWLPVVWTVPAPFAVTPAELEIEEGSGALTVTPRWPETVRLARIDTKGLPLELEREELSGGAVLLRFELTGSPFDVPSGASVEIWPEPGSLGPVVVPVYVEIR